MKPGIIDGPNIEGSANPKPPLGLRPRKLAEEAWEQEQKDRAHHLRLSQLHARREEVIGALARWTQTPGHHWDSVPNWVKEWLDLDRDLRQHVLLPHPNSQAEDVGWTWWMDRDEAVKRIFESLHLDEQAEADLKAASSEDYHGMKKELGHAQDAIRSLKSLLADKEVELNRLGAYQDIYAKQIRQKEAVIESYQKRVEAQDREISAKQVHIEQTERHIQDRDRSIRRLEERVEQLEAQREAAQEESGKPSRASSDFRPVPPNGWVMLNEPQAGLTGDRYWVSNNPGGEGWAWLDLEQMSKAEFQALKFVCRRP